MNTAKIYHDSDGDERTILQMVTLEKEWAANRIQEGEKAIAKLGKLEDDKERLDWLQSVGYHRDIKLDPYHGVNNGIGPWQILNPHAGGEVVGEGNNLREAIDKARAKP
jgi:hypothetical protein